jgi:SAM-dependent methyltransferase
MYGWQAEGIEPSAWAVKLARLKGLKIHLGTLATARLKPSSYDAITCVDVIEHVNSPRNLINQMSKLLKPNGILIVVTPNSSSLLARIMGEKWWHIRPDHFYYFSPHTLSTVCANAGLKLSFIGTYAWTFSLRYWLSRIGITTSNATWPVSIDLHDSILGCFSRNGGNIGPS